MSDNQKKFSEVDDTISTEENIPGSSISFSIGENSIYIKEKTKPKLEKESDSPQIVQKKEQWWLKKPATQLEMNNQKKAVEIKKTETPILSPDISSSMKDFLDKEKMCKKNEADTKDKDDSLQDILASVAFDKCHSDFENTTDDDIGSILEEMSKLAGAMSPVAESVKSRTINEILTEEERSVEELLLEAEKLVQQNSNNLLKDVLNTNSIPDENSTATGNLIRVKQLEVDIFKMIEQQVNEDDSVNTEKRNSMSPPVEIIFKNLNPEKTLESQKKKFEEQKVEVSSSSDLDDPIEKHSISEDISGEKRMDLKKQNLKKEITDVDKDFFDALLKKTKENAGQLSSRSSSFDQEDFTHFLKLLQEQSDKKGDNLPKVSSLNLVVDQFDLLTKKSENNENKELLEKELVSVNSKSIAYDPESPLCQSGSIGASKVENLQEESSQKESSKHSSRDSSKRSNSSVKNFAVNNKNKNELYTVGLTPRLELFADAIPKLLAEKSNETSLKNDNKEKPENENEIISKSDDNEDFSFKNFRALDALKQMEVLNDHKNITDVKDFRDLVDFKDSQILNMHRDVQDFNHLLDNVIHIGMKKNSNHLKTERVISDPERGYPKNQTAMGKSKSYDQLSKPSSKFGSSLENVKNMKPDNRKAASIATSKKSPVPKIKVQSKSMTKLHDKTKTFAKSKKEPTKPFQNDLCLDIKGSQIRWYDDVAKNALGGGDWKGISGEETLEMLYQEERQKFMYLKIELDAEIETYKSKLKDVQMLHEQEMFTLKKQNILLKAKVDELSQLNKKAVDATSKCDPKMLSLQEELERQENLIKIYESENKKLMDETRKLQNELKSNNQQKPKAITGSTMTSDQKLLEKLKDLQEKNVKLNLEISDMKQKNNEIFLKNEDVIHQNSLLQEELEMIKDQLRAKNDFITDRLQAMTTNELDLRKQLEDLKVELHSKTEQLKSITVDYDQFQQSMMPLEKELLELRIKCTYYQEKLQTAKYNCEREKQLTQKLKDQVILDNKKIMDLNRQVREMERILKRKNPDSVSALILTANSENEKLNVEKVKLLEDRIAFLENEIKTKEDMAQSKLSDIQKKFTDMKEKYLVQVLDLEQKLKTSARDRKIYGEIGTQTIHRSLESRDSEPNLADKINSNKTGPKSQNPKEDTHLIATIRGLQLELTNKDKTLTKVTKEIQELQKTNRKLQKEREKLLNERRNTERANNRLMVSSDSKLTSLKMTEGNDPNSNFYQNGHLSKKLSTSSQRLHDPMQSTEHIETNNKVKKLVNENEVLKEELSRINKDFDALKNKRLHDLNLLQEEHEKEIALIVKEYSIKVGDTKALKLQGQVNSQMAMISHLKQQIEKLQDYKEQVIILKAERDHLEGKYRMLNEKIKYLSTPSSQQFQLLQDKIAILQQRHETRELSLQKLVRDLLRNRSQGCKECKVGDKGKQQLCYFRQELDNILGTLQDLTDP